MKTKTYESPKTIPGVATEIMEIRCNIFEKADLVLAVKYAVTREKHIPIPETINAINTEFPKKFIAPISKALITFFMEKDKSFG